jgi:hypothetical protein
MDRAYRLDQSVAFSPSVQGEGGTATRSLFVTKPDDFVFTNIDGEPAQSLCVSLIGMVLTESGLLLSSSRKRRSTFCFRHTFLHLSADGRG